MMYAFLLFMSGYFESCDKVQLHVEW